MNDKASLLGQLRIDRTNDGGGDGAWKWWAAGGAAVLALAGSLWVAFAAPGGVAVQAVTVKTASTGSATGASLLDASGYVVARRQATVSSKITGKVRDVSIEEGQRVEKDQIIAHLDDSNALAALAQAQAQVVQAQANLHAAEAAYGNAAPVHERNKNLQANGTISNGALDLSRANYDAARTGLDVARSGLKVSEAALAAAQQFEDDTAIRAPFSGVITVKAAQPGEMVSPVSAGGGFTRTGIGTIVDMDSLEVEVDVSEAFISRVHAGQTATIKLNAYPDWQIPGELIAVIPTADRAKATVKVRVGFKEKDSRVVPEMGARVSFLSDAPAAGAPAAAPGALVPAEAVQANGDVGVVFVIKDKAVERRAVRLGAKGPDGQVVLSGISAGDKVAVADLSLLSDGAKIHIER
jgi:RND family efflux transporter MFP subunit